MTELMEQIFKSNRLSMSEDATFLKHANDVYGYLLKVSKLIGEEERNLMSEMEKSIANYAEYVEKATFDKAIKLGSKFVKDTFLDIT